MSSKDNIAELGKDTRITAKNAKEMQAASVEARHANKTIQQILEGKIKDGSADEFVNWAFNPENRSKSGAIALELLKLRDKFEDKQDSRENGELENKVYVYQGMEFEEVK